MLERRPVSRVTDIVGADDRPEIRSLTPDSAAEFSAGQMLQVLWRRRWLIVGCVVVALGSAMLYLSRAAPVYSSSSQVYIQQNQPVIIGDLQLASSNSSNLLTQCDVLKSTAVLSAALATPEMQAVSALRNSENPVGMLKSCVTAGLGKESELITVTAEAATPQDAAAIVNAVVNSYIEYENRTHRSTAAEVLNILQKEKVRETTDYDATSKKLLDFRRANGMLSFASDKGNIIVLRLGELSEALTTAQLDALQAKLNADTVDVLAQYPQKLEAFIASQGTRQPAAGFSGTDKLRDLQAREDELKVVYGPEHPLVQQADRQIDRQGAEMSAEMIASEQQMAHNYMTIVDQQSATAQRRVDALQKAFSAQQDLALALNAKAAELAQLEGSLNRTVELLDAIDSRMKEIHVNADDDASNSISVLETGKPNSNPVRPNRPQALGVALVIGLMVGLGAAMFRDWMDQRIRSAAEIDAVLHLAVLGAVPQIGGRKSAIQNGQEMHLQPRSEVAEAYRTVRTALTFRIGMQPGNEGVKVLLITSPASGDGKTTVASNLAIGVAQASRKVLLIDADLRRPMIHKVFDVTTDVGLSNVLSGEATIEQAIRQTNTEHLDILPCGSLPANPAELLGSPAMASLLHHLSEQYDQIIVDSPPVLAVTDACVLAAISDATVLVLRAEKSTNRMSRHARDALVNVGANVLGVVVNGARRGSEGYGYYSGYGYYRYGYGANGSSHANGNGKEIAAITVAATPTNGSESE